MTVQDLVPAQLHASIARAQAGLLLPLPVPQIVPALDDQQAVR